MPFFSDIKMSKVKSECCFKDKWLEHQKFKCWVKKVPNDYQKAYCTYCMTQISVGGLGVTALDIHVKGQKHSLTCPTMVQFKITFTPSENENGNRWMTQIKK